MEAFRQVQRPYYLFVTAVISCSSGIEIEDLGTDGVLIIDGQALAIAMASVVSFIYLSFSYRAMHVVLTRYCYRRSSVCPCVCLSVCNVDVP